jgi:cytochrome d ubiquinol oxidase subunit I
MTLAQAATTTDYLAARQLMAFALATHIVLACLGVSFPAITLIANYRGLRKDDPDALTLARRWSKVQAVLFAVGAVTGTVLSFLFGLLWPGLMGRYGGAFGIPFAIEGIFFFTEAIFLAIYIYGWRRLPPWKHFWTGVPVMIAGLGGAFAVVTANGWMNQPGGFTVGPDGTVTEVDPWQVVFNGATAYEVPHMILAAYCIGGFLVAAVYATGMLQGRRDRYHRIGFLIPFTVGAIAIPVQMFVGDFAARSVFEDQPVKFAAIELVPQTATNVPETIGGRLENGQVVGGIAIPDLASILSGFSPDTQIQGLDIVPPDQQPPATVVHWAFDIMVLTGSALVLLALWYGLVWWRRRDIPHTKWFLRAAVAGGALAIIATEAGWVVTEVGRQPWIVYEDLLVRDAVTPAGGIWVFFIVIVVLYLAVFSTLLRVLRRMAARWRGDGLERDDGADGAATESAEIADHEVPYGPRRPLDEAHAP